MQTQVNRSICLAQWKNGDNSFAMSRFIWKNGILVNHRYFYTNKLTLSSVKRIDTILEKYKGNGVMVSKNDERSMLTQSWDNVIMVCGDKVDRDKVFGIYRRIENGEVKSGYYIWDEFELVEVEK